MKSIALIFTLLLLTGCASKSKLHMDSLAHIARGQSTKEVEQNLINSPSMTLEFEDPDNAKVQVFQMVTGTQTVQTSIYVAGVNGAPGYSIPTTSVVDVTEPYYLLYKVDSLVFWGFLEEFGRSEDEGIRKYRSLIDAAVKAKRREENRRLQ